MLKLRFVSVGIVALAACAGHPSKESFDEHTCRYLTPDRSQPGLGRDFPLSETYRPSGESGQADVNMCVAADGSLVGDPTIVTSSGNRRIDKAVVTMMKAGTYCPAMDASGPVLRCFRMRIMMGPDAAAPAH